MIKISKSTVLLAKKALLIFAIANLILALTFFYKNTVQYTSCGFDGQLCYEGASRVTRGLPSYIEVQFDNEPINQKEINILDSGRYAWGVVMWSIVIGAVYVHNEYSKKRKNQKK